ncbi:porin [Pseudoalteromonas piscicida]|uniref:porin n=1 Tax=Pseudoalteromonas TaxID=53246 RepID=UPI00029ACFA4|nr:MULTISPECIES: porin [Pseudoalteromonas]MCF7512017.1 porin [Pseudoalteromonas sp. L7]MCF7524769.1 porin [Pseudoalteromonas sp. L23]MCG7554717.1 porin [Pseudoalteromonas sp. Of11M-6]MCX2768382.1 porin [Pseudoalteromonas sp. B530]QUI72112.1 porin [Pseudoalteromonas sp. M8]
MKMKYLPFVALSLCSMSVCSYANEAVSLYGRAHVGVQNSDKDGDSDTSIESYNSRMGLKGSTKLQDGLEVFYKYEFQVEITDQDKDGKSGDNLTARSQYLGVKGSYGQLLIGRDDTPMKKSQGKVDLMNDFSGDINSFFVGENRLGDTVQYTTPAINHLQFTVSYIAEDNSKQNGEDGLSLSASYGDSKLKKTNVYVAVAHDNKVAGQDINRVTVQGKLGDFKLGGMYQQNEAIDSDEEVDSFMVSAAYQIESYTLLAQYQDSDGAAGKLKDSGNAASVGVEKSLSKQARMYLWYSKFSLDNNEDHNTMAVTLRYDF